MANENRNFLNRDQSGTRSLCIYIQGVPVVVYYLQINDAVIQITQNYAYLSPEI